MFLVAYSIMLAALAITTDNPAYAIGGMIGATLAPLAEMFAEWAATRGKQ